MQKLNELSAVEAASRLAAREIAAVELARACLDRIAGLALLLGFSVLCCAQAPTAPEFQPERGLEGKDVIFVPSQEIIINAMFDLAKVTPRDFVWDLGSGDGRIVIAAAKRGARALGVEYNPELVEYSRRAAAKAGVSDRTEFIRADLYETDFSRATVITLFLLPEINLKLRPKLLELKPGTRILSNSFTMDDWEADEKVSLSSRQGCVEPWCTALLWIVPARAEGTHRIPQGEVTFEQKFQKLSGTLSTEGRFHVLDGKVTGDNVWFIANGREYRGRMNGKNLELN